jgi:general secretion pathway protein F
MQFHVRALHQSHSGIVAMQVEAATLEDARVQVEQQGYQVLRVQAGRLTRWFTFARSQPFPVVLCSQELVALLQAGLSLMESLETLAEKERHPEFSRLLQGILGILREGHTLSAALQRFPASFSPLYVATVRASERTGDLAEALTRYVAYEGQVDGVRKKLINASIYPLVLLGVGGLVMLFLLLYVVPKFSRLYEDIGGNLPLMSQLLMEWGRLLERHGTEVIVGISIGLGALLYAVMRKTVRDRLWDRIRSIPVLARHVTVYDLARFYRSLGMLLRGGIPIVQALGMTSDVLPISLRAKLAAATNDIREGQAMSSAMERHELTTPVALRMLRVGERSGQMGEMMERIAGFYDEEIGRWVDRASRLIEPVLMAVIGIVIGTIVVLMYMPIFELAGSVQ